MIHEGDRTILQMNTKLLGDPVTMLMTLVEEGLKRCSSDSTPASRKLFDVFDFGRNVLYYDLEDANDVIGDAGCEELKKLKDQKIYTTQDRLVIVDRVGRVWKNPFYPDYPPAGYDPTKDTPEPHYIGHSFQIERCW